MNRARTNPRRLEQLHAKISQMTFLDPACGCGNFLVIAYRELRLLELEILKIEQKGQRVLDISRLSRVNVDQFYGMEIEDFPAQIAQVALWLMDHQMNMLMSSTFGLYYARLPLTRRPGIFRVNALETDWTKVVSPNRLSFILGNPPFVGSRYVTSGQKADLDRIFDGVRGHGILDYVSAWYVKAAQYIQGTEIPVAFVSTKSITQGEQVGVLWGTLLESYHVHIQFAHRTFKWTSEGRGKAAVQCVIVGFGLRAPVKATIFDYETPESEPFKIDAKRINPYLVDAPDILLYNRSTPVDDVPAAIIGNQPIDGGNYLFTEPERDAFVASEPKAASHLLPWIGSEEFINGTRRFCLWVGDLAPDQLRAMPEVMRRVEAVREFRQLSKRAATRKLADRPTRFEVESMPRSTFVIIPEVSSEKREYIPMGFLPPTNLASNLVKIIPNATLYHFGVLTSEMHMAWVRYVGGRLEGRYRYSIGIIYNNFPWPESTARARTAIETASKGILDARGAYPKSTLADLYDPASMPPALRQAHVRLNREVEKAYGQRFSSDADRVAFLFQRYQTRGGGATS
jgi:hypothetical protein